MSDDLKIYDQVANGLMRALNQRDLELIQKEFPALADHTNQRFLSLRKYLLDRPAKLFCRTAYAFFFDWLCDRATNDQARLLQYLSDNKGEINRAFGFLNDINSQDWHDHRLPDDEYLAMHFVDRHIHQVYVRLLEGVLTPLGRLVAFFSRLDRGKGTDGLDIYSIVQELDRGPAGCLVGAYQNVVRNGIAHGGISFTQREVTYRDKKGNTETFSVRRITRMADDLLDVCNGMAAALRVFFVLHRASGFISPQQILLEELQAETNAPWWRVAGCVESEANGSSQLLIYARPKSRCVSKVEFSVIQTGILAEHFAPGYDRYFLALRSDMALPGWSAFDGVKLRQLRESGTDDIGAYVGVIENGLIFYSPTWKIPPLLGKAETLIQAFRLQGPLSLQSYRVEMGIPQVTCREASMHRNGCRTVLRASVVVESTKESDLVQVVRSHMKRIVKQAWRKARRADRRSIHSYLPLGFADVAVYRRDFRNRRLSGFGLGEDLVCMIRVHRITRIRSSYIAGATIETHGNWSIAWNSRWLAATCTNLTEEKKKPATK